MYTHLTAIFEHLESLLPVADNLKFKCIVEQDITECFHTCRSVYLFQTKWEKKYTYILVQVRLIFTLTFVSVTKRNKYEVNGTTLVIVILYH